MSKIQKMSKYTQKLVNFILLYATNNTLRVFRCQHKNIHNSFGFCFMTGRRLRFVIIREPSHLDPCY